MARKKFGDIDTTSTDACFKYQQSLLAEKWGAYQFLDGSEASRLFCLSVPFAVEILLQQQGWPLGRFVTVVGTPEAGKSAFVYEIGRWHRVQHGTFNLIEVEKKDSPELRCSIAGYSHDRFAAFYVATLEEWMSLLKSLLDSTMKTWDTVMAVPRSAPALFAIDSLGGATTDGIADKVDTDGHASLVQPHAANIIATYMKRLPHWLGDYPFSVVAVNHLKLSKDRYGNENVRNLQGGWAPRFGESLEIEISRLPKLIQRIEPKRENGFRTIIKVAKNSMAPKGVPLEVEFLWRMAPTPDGRMRQQSWWDWGTALIEYLIDPGEIGEGRKKELRKLLPLKARTGTRQVSCSVLDIPEDSPVSFRAAGARIEANEELKERLRDVLEIRRRHIFKPGHDLVEQRQEAAKTVLSIPDDGLKCSSGLLPPVGCDDE